MFHSSRNNVRVSLIGNSAKLPQNFQKLMSDAEERTKQNTGFHVLLGLDYGGRYDITEATKKIAIKVKDGVLKVQDIDNILFEQHLETNVIDEFRNPDLLIRSSGELRVSNFMLWQLAYTEMFFTKKNFPEFDETDLIEAIAAFQQRKRRFGGHKQ